MAKFSFFSFEWLTGEERKAKKEEMAQKVAEEQAKKAVAVSDGRDVLAEKAEIMLEKDWEQQKLTFEIPKPYKSCRLIGQTVLVVLNDGTTLSKDDPALVGKIRQAQTEDDVIALFAIFYNQATAKEPGIEKEIAEQNIDSLIDHEDFIIEGTNVYLKGVNLPIAPIVLCSFIELIERLDYGYVDETEELEKQYEALKMFWAWTALNPIASARESLLEFVTKNDITITTNGLLLMYRRVVSNGGKDHQLIQFVSNQYTKLKRWKKSPKNYWVWETDGGEMELRELDGTNGIETNHGNLEALYLDLPNMQEKTYTDGHTRKKDIRVGHVYKEDESKINLDRNESCGAGLHVGSRSFGFSGFGDVGVIALVNPMYVRSVPNHECEKMRVSEMFIAAVAELNEYEELVEDSQILDYSTEYCSENLEELERMLEAKKIDKISCQEHFPAISIVDVDKIKEMLKDRIVGV